MAKLYVTNLIILNPRDISSCDNKIKTYDSEKILVKKNIIWLWRSFYKTSVI